MSAFPTPKHAYLVCATQRSGSTLLCETLKATRIAGRPVEAFEPTRATGLPPQPRDWFIGADLPEVVASLPENAPGRAEQPGAFAAALPQIIRDGSTPNGVFAAKLMFNQIGDLEARLEGPFDEELGKVLPGLRYVRMTRRDMVAQAVSMWKAIQTQQWRDEGSAPASRAEPVYRFDAIHHLAGWFAEQEESWGRWFDARSIAPLDVDYDTLVADPAGTVTRLLAALGLTNGTQVDVPAPPLRRQSDGRSQEWTERYHADLQAAPA